MTRLKDVAVINRAALPESTDDDHTFSYVDIGSVDSIGKITSCDELLFGEAPSRARRLVQSGDSIVSTVRTYLRTVAYIDSNAEEFVVSTGFATLTPRAGVNPRFLYWSVRGSGFIEDVVARSVGVSYPAISASELSRVPVFLPSEADQTRIAAFLDLATARIDSSIAEQEQQLELLAEHRHALLSVAVGARVGGDTSALDGAFVPEVSAWEVVPLKSVAGIQSGITLGKSYAGPLEVRPYLRVANVQDGFIDTSDVAEIALPTHVIARYELRSGDILINEGNGNPANLGRGAIWDGSIAGCLHQNHVFAIRPAPRVRSLWIEYLLASSSGRAYFVATSSQVGIASTTRAKVGRFPVPLPKLQEQDVILRRLGNDLEQLERVRNELHGQIALMREHRQALVTAAVVGDLHMDGEAA